MCLKELMLTKPLVHVNVLFVTTGTFLNFGFQPNVCYDYHNLMR